jgi:hypothetical protein
LDAAGGFMYVKPELSEIVDRIVNDDDDDDPEDIIKKLMKKIKRKSSLCLAVTGSGMANGPVSYTIFVGIDLAEDSAKNKRSSNKGKK